MRQKWIDIAKGISMLLVIIGHVSFGLQGIWDFSFVYGIHLVMFFLLSGYTLKKRDITKEFINNKFSRLMVPYFYTCAAIMITDVVNSYFINHDKSIYTLTYIVGRDLLRSFFASGSITTIGTIDLGTRIGAIWFLPAMFFAVLLFQGLLHITQDDKKLGVYTAFIALLGYITARFIWLPFSIQSAMMAVFFLWIGYEIRVHGILDKIRWYHYVIAQVVFLYGIFNHYCNISFVVADISDLVLSVIVGLAGCLLIYLLSRVLERGYLLAYIGKISLTVLCVHLYYLETMGILLGRVLDKMKLSGNPREWMQILLSILFAICVATVIEWLKKMHIPFRQGLIKKEQESRINSKRDIAVDIAKGIFILLMLVGHFSIDSRLRSIIYSCHMIAFIFFSGYFYKSGKKLRQTLVRMMKSFLMPYLIFVLGIVCLDYEKWSGAYFIEVIRRYVLGMSFSKVVFTDVESVGPVYFILMLFAIRLLYMLIDRIFKKENCKYAAVLIVSIFGIVIGKNGYWLPWSFDVACYGVIFYQLGIWAKQKNMLEKVGTSHILYFVLSPIWAYMIYSGSMEIAVRNYGRYGLVIIGSMSGVMLVYKLALYIMNNLPIFAKCLSYMGEGSIIIIIIHTMLGGYIGEIVNNRFDSENIAFMVCSILLQIVLALIIKFVIQFTKEKIETLK